MIPRGEVGVVVAQIGVAMAAIGDAVYGVVLAMAVVTTLAAPPLIKLAFGSERASGPAAEHDAELQEAIR
jgi:Kef-type K+ transport system membrane component KefB